MDIKVQIFSKPSCGVTHFFASYAVPFEDCDLSGNKSSAWMRNTSEKKTICASVTTQRPVSILVRNWLVTFQPSN